MPQYQLLAHDLPACNLAVVDADHEPAVVQVQHQQRLASTVMVGRTLRRGAGAQLARPIHVPSLLQALDDLVAATPPMSAAVGQVQAAMFELMQRRTLGTQSAARAATQPDGWPIIAGPNAQQRPLRGKALLVGGNDENLHFLDKALAPAGLKTQRVDSGTQALNCLQQDVFEFVFLTTGGFDHRSGHAVDKAEGALPADMDGFHTCRLLQRLPPAQPVAPPPTLVLLLDQDNAVNRLRAERAGADAWLHPPWTEEPLLKLIDERDRWLQQSGKRK